MPFGYLVAALPVIGLEVFFVYKATANRKRANLIAGTPVGTVAELGPGPAKVQGRAVAFGDPLRAPLSDRACVYYDFQVEETRTVRRGPFGTSSHWKTVIDDVQSIACGVDDGTGMVGVDLREGELVLNPGAQLRSGVWNDAPSELERVLNERYGRSSKGLIFNKGMRYTETLIEVGEDLLVLGTSGVAPGGNWQFGKGDVPHIVSNKSQGSLLSSYKGYLLFWSVLAVLVLVACLALGLKLFVDLAGFA